MWAFYSQLLCSGFCKNVFYRWTKTYNKWKKVWRGAGLYYFSNIQIKRKETSERLMHFPSRPKEKKKSHVIGQLYLLVIIRSARWENETQSLERVVSAKLDLLLFSHQVVSNSFWPPKTAAHQASISLKISQSFPKSLSTESVMTSNHLILCCPFLLPSVFPSIRVFSNESDFRISDAEWLFRVDFL